MAKTTLSQISPKAEEVFSKVVSLVKEALAKDWKSMARDAKVMEVSQNHVTLSQRLAVFKLDSEDEAKQVMQLVMGVAPLKNEKSHDAFFIESMTDGAFEVEKMLAVGKFYDEVMIVAYVTLRPKA